MIISYMWHRLLLHLLNDVVFSPNVDEVSILLRRLGCLWLLMIFVVSYFFDFVIVFKIF